MYAQDVAVALGISSDTRESEFSVDSHTDKPLNLDFSRNNFRVTKEIQRRCICVHCHYFFLMATEIKIMIKTKLFSNV